MEKKPVEVKSLKEGGFVIIDDVPCKVTDISISKPGKHGSAKARLTAVGLFENTKKIIVKPADTRIDIPVIEKKNGQVISISDDNIQVMDLEDFSLSDVKKPDDIELKEGDEILIWKFGSNVMVKGKK
ncbi:MAG: translation initiation factor IF-5A [Candidatus Aenigmarchaeota archaeon]|nr:translation initiation factor IF-5A [Candidatus Aenigmarchaeota archaeon]